MTDERIDALLGRLDVAVDPSPDFVARSAAVLVPQVRRARSQDATRLGRARRDLRTAMAGRPWGIWPMQTRLAVVLVIALLIVATLLVAIAGSRRLPPPFGAAENGRIAFVADGHIYTADPDGMNRLQITAGSGTEFAPTFSPDGTQIAFRQFYPGEPLHDPQLADVVVAKADGSHPVAIERAVKGVGNISWSPDSRFVAYSRASPHELGRRPRWEVDHSWVVAADGSGQPVDLGTFSDGSWGPTWSPDGQHLALAAEQSLWIVNRDGSGRRKLTYGDYGEVGAKGESAEWSPDGTLLLFSAGDPGADHEVYVVGLDGSPERLISTNSDSADGGTWSPDGTQIAFMTRGIGTGPYAAIADRTGRLVRVLPGHYAWYQPTWSPDGTKLIVTDDRPGPNDNPGPAVRVILDAVGDTPPVEIPAPGITPDLLPDWAASWQRLAVP